MAELTHEQIAVLRRLLAMVGDARAYTREHYPVGHPGKFVGDHPADEYDRALDAIVNLGPALLDAAERGLANDGRIDSALVDMVKRERERANRLAEAAHRLTVPRTMLPHERWTVHRQDFDALRAVLAEQPATEEQG